MRRPRRAADPGEEGQVLAALLVVVVATVALGLALFSVGRASNLRVEAQTAADAAALAAAGELRDQLRILASGSLADLLDDPARLDLLEPDWGRVRARAVDYAGRNGARVTSFTSSLADRRVRVGVETVERLGSPGTPSGASGRPGQAEAAAEVTADFVAVPPRPVATAPPPPPEGDGEGGPGGPPPFAGTVDDLVRFRVRLVD